MQRSWLVLAGLGFFSFILVQCSEDKKEEKKEEELVWRNHSDNVNYVGMKECKACHADKFETFIETGMGQSFAPATREKSAARFHQIKPVYDKQSDFYYYPFWRNDSLIFREYRLNAAGDTVHLREEAIRYIVGSGQHTNSHITDINGYLYQAPLTWYAQAGKWDLPPGFEKGNNSRFTRLIGDECMSCHNALPGFDFESENKFIDVPHGINCERCHGPGELHIKEKKSGILVDVSTETDYSIVNPAKLSWDLQVDVCQRCHLQGNAVLEKGKTFHDFRPGMPLKSIMNVYMPLYEGDEPGFIMASHAQRLQKSQCFIQSNKDNARPDFTCITCHNPHVSVKKTGKDIFNKACNNCHQDKGCTEKVALREANQDNCVECHMPANNTLDIPHVTVHDHYIRKPVQPGLKIGNSRFIGLYAVNNPTPGLRSRIDAYLSHYEKFDRGNEILLDSAVNLLALGGKDNLEEWIRYLYLKNDFSELTRIGATYSGADAWTWYRLGRSFLLIGKAGQALSALQMAVKYEKHNLDFQNELAIALIQNEKYQEAEELLLSLLKEQPKQEKALVNLGFIYELKQDFNTARKNYLAALALNPDSEMALVNMCRLCIQDNKPNEARAFANRLKKYNPNHPSLKIIFQKLNN